MNLSIQPKKLKGSIQVPSSKSLAHRAIICASLAKGKSTIKNISYSKDIEATIQSMKALGARIQRQGRTCFIEGIQSWNDCTCPCNESGSTLRFILPIAATQPIHCTLTGKTSLFSRPMSVYASIFQKQNLPFALFEHSIQIEGKLHADHFVIPGNISSQFISGLLFACPLLDSDSIVEILPPFESQSYVDLTLDVLKKFNIHIEKRNEFTYFIPGNQTYIGQEIEIEADFSQMAFFAVLGAIGNRIQIPNMNVHSFQGDKKILNWLQYDENMVFHKQELIGQTFDLADCPDLGPILCVLAAYSKGTSRLIHASRLRYKECDRIQAMEEELRKWNVSITSDEDTIIIEGNPSYSCEHTVVMNSHNDHRIAMACCIFGLCADSPSILEDSEVIDKSYPEFYNDINSLEEM